MDRVQLVRKVVWGRGGLYDYSLLRWQESWMSGATNLTLSLMDRTQLPWESGRWVKRERGARIASTNPPFSFLIFFISPGRLYCSCRWFLGIKLLLAASCLSTRIHKYSEDTHTHTQRQILTSPTQACWQHHIYGRPIYCFSSFPLLRVSPGVASYCCLNPDTVSYVHILLCCYF